MKKLFLPALLVLSLNAFSNVQLPRIFGSGMVLQRDKPITIWGWADPKEKITVDFRGKRKTIVTGKDGKWSVALAPEAAGGPYTLAVKGKNSIVLEDVLVGDVWVCSGQSNMEWTVRNSNNASLEIEQANFPMIRHFKVPNTVAAVPRDDLRDGGWKVCTPENAGDFTAVGYFFARALTRELNVPIGLINSTWGGTHSETWTSREAFASSDEFREMIASMPRLNLDSLAKEKSAATLKRIEQLQGGLNATAEETRSWKETDFNDQAWPTMQIPNWWEGGGLGDFDGVVWFRKTVTLSRADLTGDAVLSLSTIDDSDDTYVNGVHVGSMTQKYNERREYSVAAAALREGTNLIAVRVDDTGGGGGLYGDRSELKLTTATRMIPLSGEWKYRVESISNSLTAVGPNSYPTLLFNGMIHPLLSLGIKGVIWYQGESNAGRAFQYRKAFPLMINDWRKHWNQGEFPFYFVQLASYNAGYGNSEKGSGWAELREAQMMTLSLPNTGMAVTTDIGDPNDIHPRNKQDVGKRLAAIALNKTYGKTDIVYSGPVFREMKVDGDKVVLTFDHTGGGLMTPDQYGYLRGFEIAGEDRKFRHAKAFIQENTVIVFQDGVSKPVAVRYGWADNASDSNLFNAEGFPAVPFRTDAWKGITEGAKFSFGGN